MLNQARRPKRTTWLYVIPLMLYALWVGFYWEARYNYHSMEGDATRLTLAGQGTQSNGSITFTPWTYPSGYGYPAILAFLGLGSGLSTQVLQLVSGIWLVVVCLGAFICYRELLGHPGAAVIAILILLLQPDSLFYILRGSHEKTTWLYILCTLYILSKSYRVAKTVYKLSAYIILLSILLFAIVSTNTFFATTFLTSLILSFSGGWLLTRWNQWKRRAGRGGSSFFPRLLATSTICFILVYMNVTYLYSPAAAYYTGFTYFLDRISVLLLGAQGPARQVEAPYEYVQSAWRSNEHYLMLIAPQMTLVGLSLLVWAGKLVYYLLGDWQKIPWQEQLLWLMCGAVGFQFAAGITIDVTGALFFANLQVRLFPYLTILLSPLLGGAIYALFQRLRNTWFSVRFLVMLTLVVGVVYASGASILKVVNDPVVGNQWIFFSPGERAALSWTDSYIRERRIWTDIFSHQIDVMLFFAGYGWSPSNEYRDGFDRDPEIYHYIVMSTLTVLQANRSSLALPSIVEHDRVYDVGDVQIYHRRPRTPFQY